MTDHPRPRRTGDPGIAERPGTPGAYHEQHHSATEFPVPATRHSVGATLEQAAYALPELPASREKSC